MNIFNYNPITKEFLNQTVARQDPKDIDNFLIPKHSTIIEVLPEKNGFARCFNEEINQWEYKEDNRGQTVYSISTKQQNIVDYIGEIKSTETLLEPNSNSKWENNMWVNDIVLQKQNKTIEIKNNAPSLEPSTFLCTPVGEPEQELTFNGGDSSASAILGAVNLAKARGENKVKLWDINNKNHEFTIQDGLEIAQNIAIDYSDVMYQRNDKLQQIENATTEQEIKDVTW